MYPGLLFFRSKLAKSLLQYRFDRLDGARLKALSYSPPFSGMKITSRFQNSRLTFLINHINMIFYLGTMFPWESAFSGEETCPVWAATGLREIHISADVSFAVWQYWLMQKDTEWLSNVGYEILVGVAGLYLSLSPFN